MGFFGNDKGGISIPSTLVLSDLSCMCMANFDVSSATLSSFMAVGCSDTNMRR